MSADIPKNEKTMLLHWKSIVIRITISLIIGFLSAKNRVGEFNQEMKEYLLTLIIIEAFLKLT